MKNLFSLYISVLCLFTLALYGCGDDNPTNNNNNGGNGGLNTLIKSWSGKVDSIFNNTSTYFSNTTNLDTVNFTSTQIRIKMTVTGQDSLFYFPVELVSYYPDSSIRTLFEINNNVFGTLNIDTVVNCVSSNNVNLKLKLYANYNQNWIMVKDLALYK